MISLKRTLLDEYIEPLVVALAPTPPNVLELDCPRVLELD
jgi:hypothetical protein